MGIRSYISMKYPTPHDIRKKHKGRRALIIGAGPSTEMLLKHVDKIKTKFDTVIGVNRTIRDFEDVMTYHMVMENKPLQVIEDMNSKGYRKDLTRVLNYKNISMFPSDIPIVKARRESFSGGVYLKSYKTILTEGLMEDREDCEQNFGPGSGLYSGTVSMQALHFACILGCTEIYLIGVELMFDGDYDHYYKDRHYRDGLTRDISRSKLIDVDFDGRRVCTSASFLKSAKYFDRVIGIGKKTYKIKFFDFSNGLISKAKKLDIDSFFDVKNK